MTGTDPATMLAEFMADPESDFMYLAKGVTLEVYREVRDLDIPWVNFELRQSRTYPNGAVAGNLVGFIGTDGPQEGLEVSENECLASENGEAVYEKGEDGVRIPGSLVTTEEPSDGGTLHLTIDRDLQWYVQERMAQTYNALGASWVTAVVMRVSDGHLMAVVDYPSVDPNNVDDAPRDALGSRAFTSPYEPGSTMKAISAAELIDQGMATQTQPVIAPGRLYLSDGSYIKDSFPHDDLPYTLTGVLVNSSNTGISILTREIPAETRHKYLIDFGFNEATEVGLPLRVGGRRASDLGLGRAHEPRSAVRPGDVGDQRADGERIPDARQRRRQDAGDPRRGLRAARRHHDRPPARRGSPRDLRRRGATACSRCSRRSSPRAARATTSRSRGIASRRRRVRRRSPRTASTATRRSSRSREWRPPTTRSTWSW